MKKQPKERVPKFVVDIVRSMCKILESKRATAEEKQAAIDTLKMMADGETSFRVSTRLDITQKR